MSFKILSRFANSVVNSKFARNVAVVASGTAAAQAITMAFAPVVTRLYGPEAFGLLGIFTALTAVLAPVVALTYPIAIVLPKKDADAWGLAQISFCIALVASVITAIVFSVCGEWFLVLLDSRAIAPFVMLLPLSMFFAACVQIAQQWLIRKKKYGTTAKVTMLQSFLLNGAKTGLGFLNPVGGMLVILAAIGQALHAVLLWLGIKRTLAVLGKRHSLESLKELAKKYCDFPLYRAPQIFLNSISQSLPVLILSGFFGPTSAGFYSIAKIALGLPASLIGKSVSDVFYSRITEASHNDEKLTGLILRATGALSFVGFFPFTIIIVFGPWIFLHVFGEEWRTAGEYARWLALWQFFGFINRPSVAAIAVLSLQGFFLSFEILSIVVRFLALSTGFYLFRSDTLAIILFSLAGATLNTLLIVMTILKSKKIKIHE